ncbi:MAG: Lipid biosynthesis acyltransferase [Pedosphaera sp.]|nr:Lipid biosynthesis acyltransferase [Pedosphaera sp.]
MQQAERQPKLIHAWHLERIGQLKRPLPVRILQSVLDAVATAMEAAFFHGLRCLPKQQAFILSNFVGAAQRVGARKRSITNLQMVLGKETRTQKQWNALWREHLSHVGTTAIESIHFGTMTHEYLLKHVTLEGEEHLRSALKLGKGVMLFINHLGNVGCIPAALGPRSYDISITGNVMPRPYLEKKVNELYQHGGVKRILVGEQLPLKAARAFHRNGIFASFIDYTVVEKLNHWLPFGEAELNTNIGPAILALRNSTSILYATCRRLPGRRHCLTIHPPSSFTPTGNQLSDALVVTQTAIDFLAQELRQRPEQWWPWDCAQIRPKQKKQATLSPVEP